MKKTTVLLVAMVMTASLVGCSTGADASAAMAAPAADTMVAPAANTPEAEESEAEAPAGDKLVVYGVYKAGDQTWPIDEGAVAQKAVEDLGGEFAYVDAKMNPEEYLKVIDSAIANKVSGIVTCIPDRTASQTVVDKVNETGIPTVTADDASQDASSSKLAPRVRINAYAIGEANGEWLANYAKDNSLVTDPEVGLLIMTMDAASSCVPRAEGEFDKFTELCPDLDRSKAFKTDYDGTTDKGNITATAVITAHPETKKWLVTGASEEGCVGAARALESTGLDANACVVSLGAYMAKDESKKEGGSCMKVSVYFSADLVGAGSVNVLMDIVNGKESVMKTVASAVVVTPGTYKEVMGKAAE